MNFIERESKQKLRGGYYTPLDLAIFLVRWVKEINPKSILEPSCGDGSFFNAMAKVGGFHVTMVNGFEIDEKEARKAQIKAHQASLKVKVETRDFLQWALNHINGGETYFDAVIGNPPFIRYQYLPEIFQKRTEEIFIALNLSFTKHTNAWVPFILASLSLLKPAGRLAMVVPAEIIHVIYAQSLRAYLGKECRRIVIIDPQEIWFSETLQGSVLLLAEKRHKPTDEFEGIGIYPVKQREFLKLKPSTVFLAPTAINGKTIEGKWTHALLNAETRNLIDELTEHQYVYRFKDLAEVDVGIVTGANNYFLVPDEIVKKFNLSRWAYPMFGRSVHCPGIIYDKRQHQMNIKNGKPTNFIWFQKEVNTKEPTAKAYIHYGERQGLHTRYKCRVRNPWYSVPSIYATEIGMLKRAHDIPRLILNKIGAFTTDTAYRIRSRIPAKILVGNFINSLTALSAELEGRHYGGGVLELVPSEIEQLSIPVPSGININLDELDNFIRTLPSSYILEKQDRKILKALGVSRAKQELLLSSWQKLHDRRQRISIEAS